MHHSVAIFISGSFHTKIRIPVSSIKLANNGYLVMAYMRPAEAAAASQAAQDGHVVITNGVVHLAKTQPEFFKTPYPTRAFHLRVNEADYEGAILARQEWGCVA